MAGLLVVSISSGQIIARTGKYRVFPIAGSAVTTLGLYLFSTMGPGTRRLQQAFYMVILGVGLGGVMQVFVIIVQNAVPQSELGVATSGATFFRSIGGSFGTAIFGAIFANVLVGQSYRSLARASLPPGFQFRRHNPRTARIIFRALVHQGLMMLTRRPFRRCSIVSVPICALAFVASWLIPHVELKRWTSPAAGDTPSVSSAPPVLSSPVLVPLLVPVPVPSGCERRRRLAVRTRHSVTGIPAHQSRFDAAARS